MKDTMLPKSPEDYEVAIPQDKKALRAEVEEMIGGEKKEVEEDVEIPVWGSGPPKGGSHEPVATVKCTCAKQFFTKKRNKKKGLIVMRRRREDNGYTNQGCPVHYHR